MPEVRWLARLPIFPLPGTLPADASSWRLTIAGLVEEPRDLSLGELLALPAVDLGADFACEEGWRVRGLRWRGVRVADLLRLAGVRPEARYLAVGAGDFVGALALSEVGESWPLLAHTLDGAPLPREHGGPLRLVAENTACYQSVKWVDRLNLVADDAAESARGIALGRLAARPAGPGRPSAG